VVLLLAKPLFAQSSAEVNAGIQFNFASPGARSLARGGAFIADASDATAAYANPAGLVNLPSGEVSLELRSSRFTHSYTDRGHAFGPPSGILSDTISGLRDGTSEDRVNDVAFASVVVPVRAITFAAYRHELANFAASARTQGAFYEQVVDEESGQTQTNRHYPAVSSMRLRIAGIGVSAAMRIAPRISLGVGLRRYRSEIDSTTERYGFVEGYGPPNYSDRLSVQAQHGSGSSIGVNGGALFDVTNKLSFGASYRQGFSFPVEVSYRERPTGGGVSGDRGGTARFNVPTFYGAGASLRPTPNWSIALDVNRITYSDLARDFVLLYDEEPRYFVPDGTEIRIGSELIVTRDRMPRLPFPIALSIGGWRDPDHAIRVDEPDDAQSVLFRPSSADTHVSFGIGMLFDTYAQVHAAVDHSSRQTVFSLAVMARFAR
jgi:long-subunit fatty acid transport protein